MLWVDDDTFKFDNGPAVSVPGGVIGLSRDGKDAMVASAHTPMLTSDGDTLSPEQRRELASHQIRRWKEFADGDAG